MYYKCESDSGQALMGFPWLPVLSRPLIPNPPSLFVFSTDASLIILVLYSDMWPARYGGDTNEQMEKS